MKNATTKRDLTYLLLLALAIRLATALLIHRPGYMDTAYYTDGALLLAQGYGLNEPFLWHYLDDPPNLPHPAFLYWMPLPSLLTHLFNYPFSHCPFPHCSFPHCSFPHCSFFHCSFSHCSLPHAILSAGLPLLAYLITIRTSDRRLAWTAALLTLFSGLFFPYWTLPETFTPFALLGGLALYLAGRAGQTGRSALLTWLPIGLLVGLAHLTRADGLLLLPIVALPLLSKSSRRGLWPLLAGYLLAMSPWFARNLAVVGAPLPPAGSKTLWLTTYDDLFCYHCDLSPASYLAWGWREILRSKLWATGVNLQRLLAEDGLIFMFPFILIGLYKLRHRRPFALAAGYCALTFAVHSWAFTFPGARGGFFHASVPALPFLLSAGAEGLDTAVRWAARRRRWRLPQARRVFGGAAVIGALLLSLYSAATTIPRWNRADVVYERVGEYLAAHGADGATVMVANPPAFWYHTRHPAVVVPNGDPDTLLTVARRYDVEYILLDHNRPSPLADLYTGEKTHPALEPCARWEGDDGPAILFRVRRP